MQRRKEFIEIPNRGPQLLVIVFGINVKPEMGLRGLDKPKVRHLLHKRHGRRYIILLLVLPQLLDLQEPLRPRLPSKHHVYRRPFH